MIGQHAYTITTLIKLPYDCVVCTNSHTRFDGDEYEELKMGLPCTLYEASNGTKWVTWGEADTNEYGNPTHLYRGKIMRRL